ncbi:MAG: outer membrane protein assembly factor BamD [Deltaproteobacteria bacterium]|nr:outer membrane protein assembly factor BamD [Deltaproteobacteria bacterium]
MSLFSQTQKVAWGLLIVFLLSAAAGCGWFGFGKKKPDRPPDVLAKEGIQKMKKGKYDDAVDAFEKIRDRYPYSEEAMLAQLKVADAKYFNKKYDEALQDYKNFEKLHPTSPMMPYVIYQQGLCYYRQRATIDRDPSNTYKALQEFRRLKQRYPDYERMDRAEEYMARCLRALADHEFYVGEFYFKTKRYQSALERFSYIEQEYPDYYKIHQVRDYASKCETFLANPVKADPPVLLKPWYYLFDAQW